jgi:hypothetical protein
VNINFEIILPSLALGGVLGYLFKKYFGHLLSRDLEKYKDQLSNESKRKTDKRILIDAQQFKLFNETLSFVYKKRNALREIVREINTNHTKIDNRYQLAGFLKQHSENYHSLGLGNYTLHMDMSKIPFLEEDVNKDFLKLLYDNRAIYPHVMFNIVHDLKGLFGQSEVLIRLMVEALSEKNINEEEKKDEIAERLNAYYNKIERYYQEITVLVQSYNN